MKITDVEVIRLKVPLKEPWVSASLTMIERTVLVTKVYTDEGIIGLGDAYHAHVHRPEPMAAIVETVLKPVLIGEDPFKIEVLWRKMYKAMRHLGAAGIGAMSGVDIALWDILGKSLNAPIYKLLGGGAVPPRMEPYVGSQTMSWRKLDELPDLVAEAESYVKRGYKTLKVRGGRGLPDRQEDVAAFRALRDAFGNDIRIVVDVNNGYTLKGAKVMAEHFVKYNIAWMEDPILVSAERAPETYAALSAAINVPLAIGGNLFGRDPLRKVISAGGIDIVKMDASSAGGISEIVKMSHLAEAWNMKWAPVTHEPLGQLATLHAMAAASPILTDGMCVEWDPNWPLADFLTHPPRFEDGTIVLHDGPGLGTDIKPSFIEQFGVEHF